MAELILGVDGGQTSTVALLASRGGEILGVGNGGPANHIHEPRGMERMQRSLRDAVRATFEQAGIAPVAVESACFGMTGGAEFVPEVVPKFLNAGTLTAYHDVVTALAGASVASPGIVVIAGTGAIAYGQSADGRSARAGGWGYLMGDEGSAYDVGVQVLRAAAQSADGRGETTALQGYVSQFWKKTDLAGVHRALYSQQIERAEIAGLSWVAYCAAEGGDAVAQRILARAGDCLARAAGAVTAALEMEGEHPIIYPTGGVFRAGRWVLEPFERRLIELVPDAEIRQPAFPQVVGALLLAYQQAGVSLDEPLLARLQMSLPETLLNKSAAPDCGEFVSTEKRQS